MAAPAVNKTDHGEVFAESRNLTDRNYVGTEVTKDRATSGTEMLYLGSPRSV